MKRQLPEDLLKAVKLLQPSGEETEDSARLRGFERAIGIINTHLEKNPNSPHSSLLTNFKTAHTQIILERLNGLLSSVDIATWFAYVIALQEASEEVESIITLDSALRSDYRKFLDLWRDDALRILMKARIRD